MGLISGNANKSGEQWVGIIMFIIALFAVVISLFTTGMGWDLSFLNEIFYLVILVISAGLIMFANTKLIRLTCALYTIVLIMVADLYSPYLSGVMSGMIYTLSSNPLTIFFIAILLGIVLYLVGRKPKLRGQERAQYGGTKDW